MGHERAQVKRFLERAVRCRLFPGASLLVTRGGKPVLELCAGRQTYVPWSCEITPHTWFDLASLTKPLVTALCCMALVDRGLLDLEQTLSRFFVGIPENKDGITVRHLLNHASGLPAHLPYYEKILKLPARERKDALISLVLATELIALPGQKTLYSDLGFILLGRIVELVAGCPLDEAWERLIALPVSLEGIRFRPLDRSHAIEPAFLAPSGFCQVRGRVVWGEVHDLNAFSVGGVCGHAGLFGTARGVGSLLNRLFSIYHGRMLNGPVSSSTLRYFWTRRPFDPSSSWRLGFDSPSSGDSAAGRRFSPASIGHLGFTGTSFWMDLEQDLIAILLTNRTFPRVEEGDRERMKGFRQECHDLIWQVL